MLLRKITLWALAMALPMVGLAQGYNQPTNPLLAPGKFKAITDPAASTTVQYIYTKDVTGTEQLFFQGDAGPVQLTGAGFGASGWTDDGASVRLTTIGDNVGIGTATPAAKLHVLDTGTGFRLGYDAANYTSFVTNSTGELSIVPTSGHIILSNSGGETGLRARATTGDAIEFFRVGASTRFWRVVNPGVGGSAIIQTDATGAVTYTFPDASGTVWTSGNDGTGSSLDADLLDGFHESSFALLNGRGGGQTLTGGTGATDGLTLKATSNVTAGEMTFQANGTTETMRITATGNVGIGTPSPQSLFVVGATGQFRVSSTGDLVRINDVLYDWPAAQGAASTVLTNDGAGVLSWTASTASGWTDDGTAVRLTTATDNVGIGTASPAARKLHIWSDIGQECIRLESTTTATNVEFIQGGAIRALIGVESTQDQIVMFKGSTSPSLKFNMAASSTTFTPTSTSPRTFTYPDASGTFGLFDGISGGQTLIGGTAAGDDLTFRATSHATDGDIVFESDGTPTERARITSAGLVGIGTIAPDVLLHVNGAVQLGDPSTTTGSLAFAHASVAFTSTFTQSGAATASASYTLPVDDGTSGQVLATDGAGLLSWASTSSAGGWTDDGATVRLTSIGDSVGIGTTAPASRLDVVHSATASIRAKTTSLTDSAFVSTNSGTSQSALSMASYGTVGGSIFGVTRNDAVSLTASGTSVSSLLFGTETADDLIIGTSNLERIRILSTGQTVIAGLVGIGGNTPTFNLDVSGTTFVDTRLSSSSTVSAGLELNATATGGRRYGLLSSADGATAGGGKFIVYDLTGSTERIVMDSSGFVGLNTNAADRRLDVLDAANPQIRMTQTDGVNFVDFQADSSANLKVTTASMTESRALISNSTTTALSAWSATNNLGSGSVSGSLAAFGSAYIGNQLGVSAANSVQLSVGGSSLTSLAVGTGNAVPLIFSTNSIERVRVESGGAVGIGTIAVTSGKLLDLLAASDTRALVRLTPSATTSLSAWDVTNDLGAGSVSGSLVAFGSAYAGTQLGVTAANTVQFSTGGSALTALVMGTGSSDPVMISTDSTERIRVTSGGDVGIASTSPVSKLAVTGTITATSGDISLATLGQKFKIIEGGNASMGTVTLSGGATTTVSTTAITATSRIFLTSQSDGGTPGFLRVTARNAGTDFTITSSTGPLDTSIVAWILMEPY